MVQLYGSFLRTSIRDVNRSLLRGETSVTQLYKDSLRSIELSKKLNPFITVCSESAAKRANDLDKLLESGDRDAILTRNPLFGIPISLKDNFCTESLLTTCGSKMLSNFVPPYAATAATKLAEANCLVMGKTNMDEFAMGSSCTTSYYGASANCWNAGGLDTESPSESHPSKWFMAGGSSTGSAVSVASGACFASLGTDTGGSTRQPASLTGIVGFKPTYGVVSRFGVIPLAHCLDVVSILTRCVEDVRFVFDAIVGMDENDLTSVDHRTELRDNNYTDKTSDRIVTIGVPEQFIAKCDLSSEVGESFQESLRLLSKNISDNIEFKVRTLNLPNANLATECYTVISSTEIASNMSCYDGVKYGFSTSLDGLKEFDMDKFYRANRDAALGSEVKKRILLGNYFLLEGNRDKYLVQALKLRRIIAEEFQRAFVEDNGVDIIVMPSTPTTSVSHEEWLRKQDDNRLFREDYFLIPSNLANLPSISLPAGLSSANLPIGLQVIANKFHDIDLLNISKTIEDVLMRQYR